MSLGSRFVFRLNFLPNYYSDYPLFIFTVLVIPAAYWFQVCVVFKSLFPPPSPIYYILFLLGTFEFHNVEGNLFAVLICDTSIRSRLMPREGNVGVKYCPICETHTPPRSYHCPSCNICILKRDHHCTFTGCCVGHYNHRYFINFIFHVTISVLFCIPFNLYFMWDVFFTHNYLFLISLVFPIVLFIIDLGPDHLDSNEIYMILFAIQLGGLIFCGSWLFFHMKMVLRGSVVHEMRKCISCYDMGKKKNILMVFGEKWYLTWISPLIVSKLPSDGIVFETKIEEETKFGKHSWMFL